MGALGKVFRRGSSRGSAGPRRPNLGSLFFRQSDLLLAGMIVGIVGMMIIPLPTILLDLLITTNITIAVTLLLVSIYVQNPLRFATFPSILLITTLFRLGLNVSSTRLILLQADAGEVIASFGQFVVSANLVVGAVVFAILTVIQFVVIAKGSERVAEVAARFTLDAMPGRQMSIDADLRAGVFDQEQARQARGDLQRESQLYGAMDGAMKFVKGDAIAGILITLINIIGGLMIGVLQRGMPVGDATKVYSLLTIGDGLVTQLPALLISVAAGVVVTRVASEEKGHHLAQEIAGQVFGQPRAIAIVSVLLAVLAIVPGLPTIPFVVWGVVMGALSVSVARHQARAKKTLPAAGGTLAPTTAATIGPDEVFDPQRGANVVVVEIGEALLPLADVDAQRSELREVLLPGLQEIFFLQQGVPLPPVVVRPGDLDLPPDNYRFWLQGVPLEQGRIDPDQVLIAAKEHEIREAGIDSLAPVEVPGVAPEVFAVDANAVADAKSAQLEVVFPQTQIALHLSAVLRRHGFELLGMQQVQDLLDLLEQSAPALVHEVVPKLVPLPTLTEVLRRLVQEQVSIRNLSAILHCLADWAPVEKDPWVLTEQVRVALKGQMSFQHAAADRTLRAFLLDPMIEQAVQDSIQRTEKESYLALEPQLAQEIVDAVRVQRDKFPADEPLPVLLTTSAVRRHLWGLIAVDFPELIVLSHDELVPDLRVQPVARVGVG